MEDKNPLMHARLVEAPNSLQILKVKIAKTAFSNPENIINDTIIIYYDGTLVTTIPFAEMYNYKIRIVFRYTSKNEVVLLDVGDHDLYK